MRAIKSKLKYNSGLTLIEILVSMSILAIITGTMLATVKGRDGIQLENTQASIVQALQEAQNRSATGVGETKHGVHIEENKIVTFEGDTYTGTGKEIPLPPSISTDQSDLNIIFDRISAGTDLNNTIILKNANGDSKTITITPEGLIE